MNQKMDVTTLFLSVSSAAMMGMGLIPNPETNEIEKNLEMAKHNIEFLELLQEKTKGNLTEEEEKFLTQVLYEVRMRYVEASKKST